MSSDIGGSRTHEAYHGTPNDDLSAIQYNFLIPGSRIKLERYSACRTNKHNRSTTFWPLPPCGSRLISSSVGWETRCTPSRMGSRLCLYHMPPKAVVPNCWSYADHSCLLEDCAASIIPRTLSFSNQHGLADAPSEWGLR
jgi:hypothetical protein